jgi:hypothetical protein
MRNRAFHPQITRTTIAMCHCMVAKLLWYVFAVHAWELTRNALFLSLQRGFLSTLSASVPDVSEIVLRNCDTHAPRDRRQDGKQPHGLSLGSMTGGEGLVLWGG